jgi:hypothetical protein
MVEEKKSMGGTLALDLEQKRRIQKLGCLVFIKVKTSLHISIEFS